MASQTRRRVFDTTNLRKEWQKGCAAAGLGRIILVEGKKYDPRYEGLTLHDFRRSSARNLVTEAGVPERIAMQSLGAKTPALIQRYHIVPRQESLRPIPQCAATTTNSPSQGTASNSSKT